MDPEKCILTWNSFPMHLQETFRNLYIERNFCDVTLVTDDMVQIQAHRTVLSSASPFFKQLFTINQNNNNNVLYLKGIHHQELEAMLEFIYLGEAKIDEERIHKFIDAMKDLSLKEFSTIENEINLGLKEHDVKDDEGCKIKSNILPSVQNISKAVTKKEKIHKNQNTNIFQNMKNTQVRVLNSGHTKRDLYKCTMCDVTFSRQENMRVHYEHIHL